MDQLLRFLMQNPIIALVVVFWVIGAISNVRTAAKKREQAQARRDAATPAPRANTPASPPQRLPSRDAEEVAREMRRILGLPEPATPQPTAPKPVAPAPRPVGPPIRTPVRLGAERAPTPVVPTTQARRLQVQTTETRVGSSVGEAMAHRRAAPSADLGGLGGRVHHGHAGRVRDSRFALTDLRRVLVLGEILGPPVALRDQDRRLI